MAFIDKYMKNKELDLKTQIKYFSVNNMGQNLCNANAINCFRGNEENLTVY